MTVGLNLKIRIWRMGTAVPDDDVGGAIDTAVIVYEDIRARLSQSRPSQIVLEQGLEVDMIYTCKVRPASLDIRERDEIEITWPPEHIHLNDRFRVRGVRRTSMHPRDSRGTINLSLSRIERSRTQQ